MAINKILRKKLLEMAKMDQKLIRDKKRHILLAKENVKELKKIIGEYSWPSISLVGKKGVEAAWIIVQHADFDIEFQKFCLRLIKSITSKKQVFLHYTAYLTDRVFVNEGKKQIYGTQFYTNQNNKIIPRPIKDKKNLEKRRKRFNLPPLKDYEKIIKNKKFL